MATIFSVAEARAFAYYNGTPLADESEYPTVGIEAMAELITADFARICDVSFVPVAGEVAVLDGGGGPYLALPHARVTAVAAVERWDGAAWVAETAGYRLLPDGALLNEGYWSRGRSNLRVTYTHGYAAPPEPIVRAALILAVNLLVVSNVSDRATQQTTEYGTYNLAVAGWRSEAYYGIPVVDSVLARYRERPMLG